MEDAAATLDLLLQLHGLVEVLEVWLAACGGYYLGGAKRDIPVPRGYVEDVDVYVFAGLRLAAVALLAGLPVVLTKLLPCFLVSASHLYNRNKNIEE